MIPMEFRVRPDVEEHVSVCNQCDLDYYHIAGDGSGGGGERTEGDNREGYEVETEKRRIAELLGSTIGPSFDVESAIQTMTTQLTTLTITPTVSERERQLVVIDGQQKCDLSSVEYNGRYFAYLMSHNIVSKTDSHVCFSTNPIVDVYCHNQKLHPDRNTCMAAPNWVLDIVLGPFSCKEAAIECGRVWVSRTRGKLPKQNKAPFLASINNVPMYSFQVKTKEPVGDLLKRSASHEFSRLYNEMKSSAKKGTA